MLFTSAIPVLATALFSLCAMAEQRVGYTGTLSSLDGGLGGTVKVVDPTTLEISNYKLEDASAPKLYWWGSTTDSLKEGFRISEERVTSTSSGETLTVKLDSGKTSADFMTVGLWCEQFAVNFGQAVLKASDGSAPAPSAKASGSASGTAAAAVPSKTDAAKNDGPKGTVAVGLMVAAAVGGCAALMA